MAQASRRVRKERRLRRERTLAFKMLDHALRQRDQARWIAAALEQELKKKETTLEEGRANEQDNPVDGSNENSN